MEVLYHIRPYFVRIFIFTQALYRPYICQVPPIQVPEMAVEVVIQGLYDYDCISTWPPRELHSPGACIFFGGMNTNVPGFADCPTHGFSLWSTKGQKYVTSLVIYPSMLGCWIFETMLERTSAILISLIEISCAGQRPSKKGRIHILHMRMYCTYIHIYIYKHYRNIFYDM